MSLGKDMPINTSTKQKINTRSSTKTELVAADDFLPIILWTYYFLEAQEYGHDVPSLLSSIPSLIVPSSTQAQHSGNLAKVEKYNEEIL